MLSVKVVVGGGGTSWAENVMEQPLPSRSVRVLLVGTEVERMSDGVVLVTVLLCNVYNGGGGTMTASTGV